MAQIDVPLSRSGFGQTRRVDNWWVQPVVVFLGLSAFIVYATWAALQGQHYQLRAVSLAFLFAGIVRS